MKKILFALFSSIILFSSAFVFAQESAAKASMTLETVCGALAGRPNTVGDFTQIKTITSNGRTLKSYGSFIISLQGIMWKTEKPFPSSLILTEEAMVQIAANGKKSVMDGKDNQIFSNISGTLSSVFSGNVDGLKKNFECTFTDMGSGKWTLFLSPKDSTIASVMKSLQLSGSFNNMEAELESLEMAEASGNTIKYEFTNQKYPKELSADEKQNFIIN
ncbi:MAG: outer-membrane lipoprotein carrier protein LolA [Treponema sp.]|nr:outer-membrane lipoprotein carrier protein LolA [Treponema sp.]